MVMARIKAHLLIRALHFVWEWNLDLICFPYPDSNSGPCLYDLVQFAFSICKERKSSKLIGQPNINVISLLTVVNG
jgi:hypothetical protein